MLTCNVAITFLNQVGESGIIWCKRGTVLQCNLSSVIFFELNTSGPVNSDINKADIDSI